MLIFKLLRLSNFFLMNYLIFMKFNRKNSETKLYLVVSVNINLKLDRD